MKRRAEFVNGRRKEVNFTQEKFAEPTGVALSCQNLGKSAPTGIENEKATIFIVSVFDHIPSFMRTK